MYGWARKERQWFEKHEPIEKKSDARKKRGQMRLKMSKLVIFLFEKCVVVTTVCKSNTHRERESITNQTNGKWKDSTGILECFKCILYYLINLWCHIFAGFWCRLTIASLSLSNFICMGLFTVCVCVLIFIKSNVEMLRV